MLAKYNFIFAQVLLRRVFFKLLNSDLILEELFSRSLQSLFFYRSWHVALFEDASWDENIVVDFLIFRCHTIALARREQEPIEIIFVLSTMLVWRKADCSINVENCSFSNHQRLTLTQVTYTIHSFKISIVAFCEIILLLQLLNV